MKASDLGNGLLGLFREMRGWLPGLLTFVAVVAAFVVTWALWSGVTVIKLSNESTSDLSFLAVTEIDFEGDEEPLWQGALTAKDFTYKITFGCCHALAMKYEANAQPYNVRCDHSDWREFPDFEIVFPQEGPAYCRNCRRCYEREAN